MFVSWGRNTSTRKITLLLTKSERVDATSSKVSVVSILCQFDGLTRSQADDALNWTWWEVFFLASPSPELRVLLPFSRIFCVSTGGVFPTLAPFCPVHFLSQERKAFIYVWLVHQWLRAGMVYILGCCRHIRAHPGNLDVSPCNPHGWSALKNLFISPCLTQVSYLTAGEDCSQGHSRWTTCLKRSSGNSKGCFYPFYW